ncbi:hypothetical protein Tco_0324486 [Tanacetum coccineum]
MSLRPKDVESIICCGSLIIELLSFLGLLRMLFPNVVPCFVALCLPVVVMEILDGFLYLLLENHVILSLFRVCALICFLLVNLMIPWFSELYSDMVVIGESYDSLEKCFVMVMFQWHLFPTATDAAQGRNRSSDPTQVKKITIILEGWLVTMTSCFSLRAGDDDDGG